MFTQFSIDVLLGLLRKRAMSPSAVQSNLRDFLWEAKLDPDKEAELRRLHDYVRSRVEAEGKKSRKA